MAKKEESKEETKPKKVEKKEKSIVNLDSFKDQIELVSTTKNHREIGSHVTNHLNKILEKYSISKDYHFLFIYEPHNSINQGMVDKIYNAIPDDNKKPILLILHNNDGRIEPAYLISKTCKELSSKFGVAIPRKAKSAATLIALGGSEIHMGPMSELGPIDPQFGGLPALGTSSSLESIAKIVSKFPDSSVMFADYMKDKLDLRILGYFERVSESAKQYALRLLSDKDLPKSNQEIAHQLVYEYKDHSFVIDKEEACELLGETIKVNSEEYRLSNDIHKFMTNINMLTEVFYKKNLAIIGSTTDLDFTDKKEDDD
ncbi:MAG: hypothetical protein ABJI69_08770 [Balneola sp.]